MLAYYHPNVRGGTFAGVQPIVFFRMAFNQAVYKWGISLLIVLAMTAMVTLYVYLKNTSGFANRSMQLIMKNMGHNMYILPEAAEPYDTYFCTDAQILFPETITKTLAADTDLSSKYYVSVLQHRIALEGKEFLLTGIQPVERPDETKEKGNMIVTLKEKQARLGAMAASHLHVSKGEPIAIQGTDFNVTEVVPVKGTVDDYRIYIPLSDCQTLFNTPGQINCVLAFACLIADTLEEVDALQAQEMEKAAPGYKHVSKVDMARGRHLARAATQGSLYYLLGLVLAVTVLLIAITGLQEVYERTREVGILLSMGAGYGTIIGLYVVKILLLALTAACIGFWLGSVLSVSFNSSILVVNTSSVRILWNQLPQAIELTCLVALCAEIIPMVRLVTLDPTATLIEE